MDEPPDEAQKRFREQIGEALHEMGYRLQSDESGHLAFRTRYRIENAVLFGILSLPSWIWCKALGYRIEIGFLSDSRGTTVDIYSKTGTGLATALSLLGRPGHWPSNPQDPDWLPRLTDEDFDRDPYADWDGMEIDPNQLDPTTRRALRKSGRLPSG
jgi:hypothetical protein